VPFKLSQNDTYPRMNIAESAGWVAHRFHSHHGGVNLCAHGQDAGASGCVVAVGSEAEMPSVFNDRPVRFVNDTHVYDLHQFSPVLSNGWVLLGDLGRYVSTSSKRFSRISLAPGGGLTLSVIGVPTEPPLVVSALKPAPSADASKKAWTVVLKTLTWTGCTVGKVAGQPDPACTKVVQID